MPRPRFSRKPTRVRSIRWRSITPIPRIKATKTAQTIPTARGWRKGRSPRGPRNSQMIFRCLSAMHAPLPGMGPHLAGDRPLDRARDSRPLPSNVNPYLLARHFCRTGRQNRRIDATTRQYRRLRYAPPLRPSTILSVQAPETSPFITIIEYIQLFIRCFLLGTACAT